MGEAEAVLRAQVRAALRTARITQAKAARDLSVSEKHLSQMLTGRATLTLDWAERLVALCGLRLIPGRTDPMASGTSETVTEAITRRLKLRSDLPEPAERRSLREAVGLSQQEIADIVGVTRNTISGYELGVRAPQGAHLDRYVEALRALREATQ